MPNIVHLQNCKQSGIGKCVDCVNFSYLFDSNKCLLEYVDALRRRGLYNWHSHKRSGTFGIRGQFLESPDTFSGLESVLYAQQYRKVLKFVSFES